MAITKFMQVMFSATENEDQELANQVAEDIEAAKESGNVETDELDFRHIGDGNVMVHDKVNDELTLAQQSEDDPESYDLVAVPDEMLESYLHPLEDGVSHVDMQAGETEDFHDHVGEEYYMQGAQNVEDLAQEHAGMEEMEEEMEERGFSVYTENVAVQRIFSDQEFLERLFSEVIESEETAKVGDIKIEKIDDDTVLVTSEATGDQAKVELNGEDMEVTELEQKEMSEDEEYMMEEGVSSPGSSEQYEPMFVVGVDVDNHVIVDAPVYDIESAQDLVGKLSEAGVQGIDVFESPEDARDHAELLLNELGVEDECQVCEPEQAEFSDYDIYMTRFFSYDELEEAEEMERLFSEIDEDNCTEFMLKMFSETEDDAPKQEMVEDALESGEEIETDEEIITPISENEVVVEDKESGEFTKIVVNDDDMDVEKISEEEAEDLVEDIAVEKDKEFSITSYMVRLFSDTEELDGMRGDIEAALESGEEVETSDEIISPISENEVIVEDKESGEFTKVELEDDGELDAEGISEEEVNKLIEDYEEEQEDEEEDDEEDNNEEKNFSDVNPILSKFFADAVGAPVAVAPQQVPVEQQAVVEQQPVVEEAAMPMEAPTSVEAIEDKALAAVEAIHAAAQDAANMIQQAKEAPVPGQEEDLQEAQFSNCDEEDEAEERFYCETETIATWLNNNIR
jgi:hypothetical protein